MHEAVSDVLLERAREHDGINRMVLASLFAHGALIATLVLMPASWRRSAAPADVTPMMITLSNAGTGPDTGGLTAISNKPLPKTPAKTVDKPVDKSTARRPTSGPEIKTGDARVETGGAAIPFGGLTRPSGSGAATGSPFTDYADFCCPSYLNQMADLIKRNWNQNQGATGQVQMKFTIRRDGTIQDVRVEKPSNISLLDVESQRALLKTAAVPPLPREFTENTLTVHLIFDYHR